MMTHTHGISGAAAWITMSAILYPHPVIVAAGTGIVWSAATLPDIDNPDSRPGHQLDQLIPGLPVWLEQHAGHRGITHWGISAVLLGGILAFLLAAITPVLAWLGVAVGLGWLVHILGDCLTWQGAPLLAPFVDKSIRPPYGWRFKTGGRFELLIVRWVFFIWLVAATNCYVFNALKGVL